MNSESVNKAYEHNNEVCKHNNFVFNPTKSTWPLNKFAWQIDITILLIKQVHVVC